jgi:hypothetical protein
MARGCYTLPPFLFLLALSSCPLHLIFPVQETSTLARWSYFAQMSSALSPETLQVHTNLTRYACGKFIDCAKLSWLC